MALPDLKQLECDLIIFPNLDAITGALFTGLIGERFGRVEIVHTLREEHVDWEDSQFLTHAASMSQVLLTCWSNERVNAAIAEARSESLKNIRVYSLVETIRKFS